MRRSLSRVTRNIVISVGEDNREAERGKKK